MTFIILRSLLAVPHEAQGNNCKKVDTTSIPHREKIGQIRSTHVVDFENSSERKRQSVMALL